MHLWWSNSRFLKVFYVLKEFQYVFTITVHNIYIIPVVTTENTVALYKKCESDVWYVCHDGP